MFALIGSHDRVEPMQITGLLLAMNVPPLVQEDNCVIVLWGILGQKGLHHYLSLFINYTIFL